MEGMEGMEERDMVKGSVHSLGTKSQQMKEKGDRGCGEKGGRREDA